MNWLFRRHFWLMNLVFLSIVALILAKTFTTILGYWASKSVPEKPVGRVFIPREEPPALRNFALASERNLFDAKREQINLTEEDEEEDTGRWQDAGPTSLPLKLVSTMVFFEPFDSRATILELNSNRVSVFSLGECEPYQKKNSPEIETVIPHKSWELERPCNDVFGLATVVRIQEERVYIINHRTRKYEFLSLVEGDTGPYKEKALSLVEGEEVGAGVRKTGPTSYEIDQAEFDKAMANVARLMTEARAVLETDSAGNHVGFKIAYLKEGSLFDKIGIEKLDVLTRINGYELNSPEKALQLFSKLRSANQFTIDLKRGDRSVTLDYSVVR